MNDYIHNYKLTPDSTTTHNIRNLHQDHSFAINEALGYLNEFSSLDYEDFMGISRVKFMLKQNVYEFRNKATRNVVERVGWRLKDLPSQDWIVEANIVAIRELWILLKCAGVYYSSVGPTRDENRKKFYEILADFKTKY